MVEYQENLASLNKRAGWLVGIMPHPSENSCIAPYSSVFYRVAVGSTSDDLVFFNRRQNTQKDVK